MPAFLVDEDLPRSLAVSLRDRGRDAIDVRDFGLRGSADAIVFQYARDHSLTIITADVGFANEIAFPPELHHGIVLCRFPNSVAAPMLVEHIIKGLEALADEDLRSATLVIEPGQIRLRRLAPRT